MIDEKTILEKILRIIEVEMNRPLDHQAIHSDINIGSGGLELDSISTIELVVQLEEEFGVVVPDEEIDDFINYTLGQVTKYVSERITL